MTGSRVAAGCVATTAVLIVVDVVLAWVNDWPVLMAAAAFVPVRMRVQTAVDRRFNRARYDAAVVVEQFAARLRNDLDLRVLAHDLGDTVASTMQPTHVSLWLAGSQAIR